jgi:flavin reductase (DIM6/NTAB) family NADH-FMN oxidoreductase RutF
MTKIAIESYRPVYPTPAALITSISPQGKPNIITLGETFNLSLRRPTIVGVAIAKARYSHELISQTREFVVNLPPARLLEQVDRCGTTSGRQVDKFATYGLTPLPAKVVKPPLIAECPVNIECQVIAIEETGDHDLFQGRVVAVHADEGVLDAQGRVSVEKLDVLCFMHSLNCGAQYWSLGKHLGDMGFTRKR